MSPFACLKPVFSEKASAHSLSIATRQSLSGSDGSGSATWQCFSRSYPRLRWVFSLLMVTVTVTQIAHEGRCLEAMTRDQLQRMKPTTCLHASPSLQLITAALCDAPLGHGGDKCIQLVTCWTQTPELKTFEPFKNQFKTLACYSIYYLLAHLAC